VRITGSEDRNPRVKLRPKGRGGMQAVWRRVCVRKRAENFRTLEREIEEDKWERLDENETDTYKAVRRGKGLIQSGQIRGTVGNLQEKQGKAQWRPRGAQLAIKPSAKWVQSLPPQGQAEGAKKKLDAII